MPKMKVTTAQLNFAPTGADSTTGAAIYRAGDVFECTDEEAYALLKDKVAVPASDSEETSAGENLVVDPVEQAVLDGKFDELRESGVIAAPPGAAALSTPVVGPGAFLSGMERLPADAVVEPAQYEG
jgi:hypothetical protein